MAEEEVEVEQMGEEFVDNGNNVSTANHNKEGSRLKFRTHKWVRKVRAATTVATMTGTATMTITTTTQRIQTRILKKGLPVPVQLSPTQDPLNMNMIVVVVVAMVEMRTTKKSLQVDIRGSNSSGTYLLSNLGLKCPLSISQCSM